MKWLNYQLIVFSRWKPVEKSCSYVISSSLHLLTLMCDYPLRYYSVLVSFHTFLLNSDHAVNNNHCLCQATGILTEKKEVKLGNGAVLPYTKLLLATGSKYVINKLTRNLVVFVSNWIWKVFMIGEQTSHAEYRGRTVEGYLRVEDCWWCQLYCCCCHWR